jgi:hypothetical protein
MWGRGNSQYRSIPTTKNVQKVGIGILTGYGLKYSTTSRIQRVEGGSFRAIRRPKREAHHSPNAEVKKT